VFRAPRRTTFATQQPALRRRLARNVKAVQKMHASAAMTLDIYADLFDDDLEAVATALDQARARESVGKMWARPREPTR
jgi:hypothetical protein